MRGRAATILTVLGLGMALGLTPAGAAAHTTAGDIAATHAYIRANYALNRATQAKVKTAQASIEAAIRKLGEECPKLGVGSPQDEEAQHLSYEVVVALWSTSYATDAGPIDTFAKTVQGLHWSDPKLTRMARRYAGDLGQLAELKRPDVCGDITAWKEAGYKAAPADTVQLDRRVEAIEPKAIPASLLGPYEQPGDRAVLARTTRIETQLQQIETVQGFEDWDQGLEAVGLNQ